jgi:acyl-coenzyme A synthetase/AMP-(fatty) acid ligase
VTSVPEESQTRIPIGRPCANTEALVLRADGALAAADEEGELHIRGAGVAAGYWNDPEKTSAAFVDSPLLPGRGDRLYRTGDLALRREDGTFEFLGRNDEQVKYMGYRIATSDVEAALIAIGGISEAAVFLDDSEGLVAPELVALVQCEPGCVMAEIGKDLALRLPRYMVPKHILPVASLPRTDRGKVAKQQLRALVKERPA